MVNKIFISHSSKDIFYVEKIIDLLEIIGIKNSRIFCSSFEGYGIELGEDFLDRIKRELNEDVLVLFILSENFFSSPVSLCEMGATWVKTNQHIPILLPGFDFSNIKGVIPNTQGLKLTNSDKLNSLKTKLENLFNLSSINFSIWERKRNNILNEIKRKPKLEKKASVFNNEILDESVYSESEKIIKSQSEIEWPDDFEMRVHYIEKQKEAVEQLKSHNPSDLSQEEFGLIRKKAESEWPLDYEMRFHIEQKQVDSLRKLKSM